MAVVFSVSPADLPVAHKVAFKVTGTNTFYVTSQPVYVWPGTSPYPEIAQTPPDGIYLVLSVRDPAEYINPLVPFDLTEIDQFILNNVTYSNIPLPHIPMTQVQFNQQGHAIAKVLNDWKSPGLVHCSSGDRASAAFACYMITYGGWSNEDALKFAEGQLALKNQQFIAYLTAYK